MRAPWHFTPPFASIARTRGIRQITITAESVAHFSSGHLFILPTAARHILVKPVSPL
jgi:hypothetical protein